MSRTTQEWEALLEGATPGPWEAFHDEWEEEQLDGQTFEYEQSGVIGGDDGILDTRPRPSLMDAPNQWEESGEHDNRANTRLAAAAPEAVSEVVRLRRELEELRDDLGKACHFSDPDPDDYSLGEMKEAARIGRNLTRILNNTNGDTDV